MSEIELKDDNTGASVFDLSDFYTDFVPFTMNSVYPIHRWYRFKEGFSRDLVHLILGTLGSSTRTCLDPFAGSGTVPLACQEVGIRCHSIEVNPFLYHVTKAKLNINYRVDKFSEHLARVCDEFERFRNEQFSVPKMSTLAPKDEATKWLFSGNAIQAILNLKHGFSSVPKSYSDLFLVILASILPDIGNTVKDGKCVRYKEDWKDSNLTKAEVKNIFLQRANIFLEDVRYIEKNAGSIHSNSSLCRKGSALNLLQDIERRSVDTAITSPPYLNSFDYTDVYMPEIWALGFVKSYREVHELRASTLKSHVQVKWQVNREDLIPTVKTLLAQIEDNESLWNNNIPDMIAGYFSDMSKILAELARIIRNKGKLVIVVATSSYYGINIPTDVLLSSYAKAAGFRLDETRIIRYLKRSSEQPISPNEKTAQLHESMLIFSRM